MNFLSDKAVSIEPYVPGQQPKENVIKLNTNENPYPLINENDFNELREVSMAKYPDPNQTRLKKLISEKFKLKPENVFFGNGSDEVLALSFLAFFNPFSKKVAIPEISYSFYEVYGNLFSVEILKFPLLESFEIGEIDLKGCQGLVIANPNAPTSLEMGRDKLVKIIEENPDKLILVDEAYADFGTYSLGGLVNTYPNLLVVRTFSKSYSLAGGRLGFAVGNEKLIEGLLKIKDSFNSYPVNVLTQKLGEIALLKESEFLENLDKVKKTRDWFSKKLKELGFFVLDSKTNFVFAKSERKSAEEIFNYLKSEGIFVRWFNKEKIHDYLRISMGKDEEMEIVVEKLRKFLK